MALRSLDGGWGPSISVRIKWCEILIYWVSGDLGRARVPFVRPFSFRRFSCMIAADGDGVPR